MKMGVGHYQKRFWVQEILKHVVIPIGLSSNHQRCTVKEVRHKVGRKKFRDGWLPNVEEFKHLRVVFTSEKGAGD